MNYTVRRGDTLGKLAKEYGTTVKALAEANGIKDVNLIRVGQELVIPGQEASADSSSQPGSGASEARARPVAVASAPEAAPRWMEIALAEQGQAEVSTAGQDNPRIVEYHSATTLKASDDETPWCSSFVNWVMSQSGHDGTRNALASSWLSWGQELNEPRYGAITVIRSKSARGNAATGSRTGYHVGFLVERTEKGVRLLGGNQSDSVKVSTFSLERYTLEGYRWPA